MSPRRLQAAGLVLGLGALVLVLASATLIDRRPPEVERIGLSRPAGNDKIALTHAAVDVRFTEPVDRRTVEARFRIQPAVEGSLSWDGDQTLIFTPDPRFPVATEFTVFVDRGYRDRVGNVNDEPSDPFVFRTVDLPVLASAEPADGADGVALEDRIRLTFDRLMDTRRTERSLRIRPAAPVRTAWEGTTLTLTPTEPLAPGTRYRLEIGTDAADTDGNRLARPITVAFTTVEVGLRVAAVLPRDATAGAAVGGPVAVVFDAPIDRASIGQSIRLSPGASGRLTVESVPDDRGGESRPDPRVLVFTPDGPLTPHTTYTVELRGVVRAAGSARIAAARSWTFTTGGAPDVLQNQVAFLSDRSGVRNVWAMNPDGTNQRQITTELAPVSSFDISSDGALLVYASGGSVKRLSLENGALVAMTPQGVAEYAPRLLPDRSAVIVGRRERATGHDAGIWFVPLRDGAGPPRALVPDGSPPMGSSAAAQTLPGADGRPAPWTPLAAVSPDSAVVTAANADGELMRVALTEDRRTVSTGLRDPLGPPSWAATRGGFLVVATRAREPRPSGWVVLRSGTAIRGPAVGAWPSATAAGAAVGVSTTGRLEYRSSSSASPVVLTSADEYLDRQPVFSPRGDAVLFVRVARTSPEESRGIWLVSVDGGEPRQLSPDGSDPRWLP